MTERDFKCKYMWHNLHKLIFHGYTFALVISIEIHRRMCVCVCYRSFFPSRSTSN